MIISRFQGMYCKQNRHLNFNSTHGALAPSAPSAPSNNGSVSTQCWHAWRLLVVEFCANLHHHRYMLAKERNMK